MKTGGDFAKKMLAARPSVNVKSFAVHYYASYVEFLALNNQLDQAREQLARVDEELQKLKEEEVAKTFYERALKHADKARRLVQEAEASDALPTP